MDHPSPDSEQRKSRTHLRHRLEERIEFLGKVIENVPQLFREYFLDCVDEHGNVDYNAITCDLSPFGISVLTHYASVTVLQTSPPAKSLSWQNHSYKVPDGWPLTHLAAFGMFGQRVRSYHFMRHIQKLAETGCPWPHAYHLLQVAKGSRRQGKDSEWSSSDSEKAFKAWSQEQSTALQARASAAQEPDVHQTQQLDSIDSKLDDTIAVQPAATRALPQTLAVEQAGNSKGKGKATLADKGKAELSAEGKAKLEADGKATSRRRRKTEGLTVVSTPSQASKAAAQQSTLCGNQSANVQDSDNAEDFLSVTPSGAVNPVPSTKRKRRGTTPEALFPIPEVSGLQSPSPQDPKRRRLTATSRRAMGQTHIAASTDKGVKHEADKQDLTNAVSRNDRDDEDGEDDEDGYGYEAEESDDDDDEQEDGGHGTDDDQKGSTEVDGSDDNDDDAGRADESLDVEMGRKLALPIETHLTLQDEHQSELWNPDADCTSLGPTSFVMDNDMSLTDVEGALDQHAIVSTEGASATLSGNGLAGARASYCSHQSHPPSNKIDVPNGAPVEPVSPPQTLVGSQPKPISGHQPKPVSGYQQRCSTAPPAASTQVPRKAKATAGLRQPASANQPGSALRSAGLQPAHNTRPSGIPDLPGNLPNLTPVNSPPTKRFPSVEHPFGVVRAVSAAATHVPLSEEPAAVRAGSLNTYIPLKVLATKKSLQSLQEKRWLNDDAICLIWTLLNADNTRHAIRQHIMGTDATKLREGHPVPSSILQAEKAFFSINHGNSHWTLVEVLPAKDIFEAYDPNPFQLWYAPTVKSAERFLNAHAQKRGTEPNRSSRVFSEAKSSTEYPMQSPSNTSDCGMYISAVAVYSMHGSEMPKNFVPDVWRRAVLQTFSTGNKSLDIKAYNAEKGQKAIQHLCSLMASDQQSGASDLVAQMTAVSRAYQAATAVLDDMEAWIITTTELLKFTRAVKEADALRLDRVQTELPNHQTLIAHAKESLHHFSTAPDPTIYNTAKSDIKNVIKEKEKEMHAICHPVCQDRLVYLQRMEAFLGKDLSTLKETRDGWLREFNPVAQKWYLVVQECAGKLRDPGIVMRSSTTSPHRRVVSSVRLDEA